MTEIEPEPTKINPVSGGGVAREGAPTSKAARRSSMSADSPADVALVAAEAEVREDHQDAHTTHCSHAWRYVMQNAHRGDLAEVLQEAARIGQFGHGHHE